MGNLQDGDWDLSDLKYTTLDEGERKAYVLEPGDILVNRTNSKELVGKCAVFRESGEWVFASYLIRLRLKEDAALLPEFLARFLNSDVGRPQIDQLSRQIIGMANINATEIRELRIPRPSMEEQREMVDGLNEDWTARHEAGVRVRALLAAGDHAFAEELGIALPDPTVSVAYAATRAQLVADDRLNAEFQHPERVLLARAIGESGAPARLHDLAVRITERVEAPSPDDFYIGLADVERDTGELTAVRSELPEGACVRFRSGDVLFSKLRPYLNKVHIAERDGICSPEFLVLRPKPGVRVEYLAAVLRSRLVLGQTSHMAGGNTHPRLLAGDVNALLIPLPEEGKQHEVADEAAEKRVEAQALKEEAEAKWSAAKQRFGDRLIRAAEQK
jgi:hypothetical protein